MKVIIDKRIWSDFSVKLAYLFGSAARGDENISDIDIAVFFNLREPDPVTEIDIAERLGKKLTADYDKKVGFHVSPLNSAGPLFQFEAVKEGRVLYAASEEERIDFEMKVLREYGDFKAKSRFYEDALKERLKKRKAI